MQNMARETSLGQEEGSSSTPVAKVGCSGQQHQASPGNWSQMNTIAPTTLTLIRNMFLHTLQAILLHA